MTARKPATARTATTKATPAKKATATKPAPAKAVKPTPAVKPAAKRSVKPAAKPTKLSTDSNVIPNDLTELRKLIKITRDRRWRAGRRDDAELFAEMDAKLTKLNARAAKLAK